jgi:tetratricopeptide (TPR) repeat protein
MFLIAFWIAVLSTGTLGTAADYPASLELELQSALELRARDSTDPHLLTKVASLYLDLGVDLYQEKEKRLAAYEEGARFARRALELQEGSAEAHYLYAANLGSAAQLKGVVASALTVSELKAHVRRALELKHDHAPALHMMGMMLEELPWFLGGDREGALNYLKRAVAVDPGYTHARLDLAKAYIKR